jgi:DNA topoisomerase VI subunit A
VVSEIKRGVPPKLSIPSRSTSNIFYDEKNRYYVLGSKVGVRSAASMKQVKKFAQLLCAADFAKELIRNKKFATLREMYYTAEGWETGPFVDQGESDLIIEDLEATFGLKREDLGLTPEEDGAAVYGQLVVREGDVVIDATRAGRAGYTIPPTIDDVEFLKCKAKRVIAIETMGMYHRLVQEEAWKKFDALIVGLKGQAARATRRFLKRAHDELGLPVHIFCVDGDEPIFVERNGGAAYLKIRDVVEDFNLGVGLKALSVDEKGKVAAKEIVNATVHEVSGYMYEIILEGGYGIKVTGDHSLIVLDRHCLKPKPARELRNGDLVAMCFGVPGPRKTIDKINLIELIRKEDPTLFKSLRLVTGKGKTKPLSKLVEEIPIGGKLRWRKSKLNFPIKVEVTPEFCRLLGYYAAEGNVGNTCTLSFNSGETENIEDAAACIKSVWGCNAYLHKPHPTEIQIHFGGIFLAKILEHIFKVGKGACSKRVPWIIFNVPDELKIEFLRGYFRGDGRFDAKKNSSLTIWAKTVSRELASGIIFLISQLGGFASIQYPKIENGCQRAYLINISNRITLNILSRVVEDLGGDVKGVSVKAPFVERFPTEVLLPLRPVLRHLFHGVLEKKYPPASWKDKRISYRRIKRLISSPIITKTSKLTKAISLLDQNTFTSDELTERVNTMFNPPMSKGSVRSVLNYLRRHGVVRRVGKKGTLNTYASTERIAGFEEGLQFLKFIRTLIENKISLVPIKEIKKEWVDTTVYDIEVADAHTFVGGLGPIIQHNCDGDPFGFHIAMVIISGSAKLAYINHELAVPDAQFLGVTASDIVDYDLPTDKLRELDIGRLKQLQRDPRYSSDFWQGEIKRMLELGRKAEQQAFAKYGLSYVVKEYLPAKLGLKD